MSEYLILIYRDESELDSMTDDERRDLSEAHREFARAHETAVVGGNVLMPSATATSLRPGRRDGRDVTDGPFVETKEALGGYYLIEAGDLDEALAVANDVPLTSGGLEVRPVRAFR